jgi:hypothetical protein
MQNPESGFQSFITKSGKILSGIRAGLCNFIKKSGESGTFGQDSG